MDLTKEICFGVLFCFRSSSYEEPIRIFIPSNLYTLFRYIYDSWLKKNFFLLGISLLSIFLISYSLTALNKLIKLNSLENKIVLDEDKGIYSLIYIDAIYISKIENKKLFYNEKLQKTFINLFNEVNKKKALIKYYNGRGHFGESYAIIRNSANFFIKDLAIKENIPIIEIKKEISIKLISANFKSYTKHIFKKFMTFMVICLCSFIYVVGRFN